MTTGDTAGDEARDRAEQIQRELEAALEAVAEHARVSARLARAKAAEEGAYAASVRARQDLLSQADDVRKLESYSPTRIWAALRGSRDAELDREKAEHQAAEYAVARTEAFLLTAATESKAAAAELAALGDVAGRRDEALRAKEAWLVSTGHAHGAALARIAEELATTRSALKETHEAITAADAAGGRLDAAGRTLQSAGSWAGYDTFFGGGMVTDMVKYNKMDEAQRQLHDADQALRVLATELADVDIGVVVRGLGVDGLTQAFDVFFDNIFTDWSVRSRITEAQKATDAAIAVVVQIRSRLGAEASALSERESTLTADRERILTGQ